MKVLEVLDAFYPNVDGPIEVAVSIARKFREKGYGEMDLLVPDYPEKVDVGGINIYRCKSLPSNGNYRAATPRLDGKIKKIIKNGNYDIIQLHSPFPLGKYALRTGRKLKIPVVFTMHTKYRDEFENRLKLSPLVRFMMSYIMRCINSCDAVTAVSAGTVDTLKEYGYKGSDVKVICNATSMTPDVADESATVKLRQKLGLDGVFAFAFVGRLVAAKNIEFSLRALAKVKERGFSRFKFVVVGDGEYAKTLKKITERLDLTENTVFVGSVADKKLLASYYSACDALLFPSSFDTAGIVVIEAAANGTPSVTLKGSCAAERITDGVNGFVWGNDVGVWADGIINLMQEPERARIAGKGAQASVYRGWDDIAEEYFNLYKSLIEGEKK